MYKALVFGYGQNKYGVIDEQTQDRCKVAVRSYRRGEIDKIYLTVSASKNGVSMAGSMRDFLVTQGVRDSDIMIDRRGGNTAGELDVFLSVVPDGSEVLLISTWYHISRIVWLAIWRMPSARFSVEVAWKHVHFKGDFLKEFLKLANAILRPKSSSKIFPHPPL